LRNKVSVVYRLQFEKQSFENVSLRNSVCSVSATDLKNKVSKTEFRKLCFLKNHTVSVP